MNGRSMLVSITSLTRILHTAQPVKIQLLQVLTIPVDSTGLGIASISMVVLNGALVSKPDVVLFS